MALPKITDPAVILASPTREEQREIWTQTHPPWGPGLTVEQYINRELYLLDIGLARDGGLSPWILTISGNDAPNPRPILASCETLRKRGIYRDPKTGIVHDVIGHGVASVFTFTRFRKNGYASKMMTLLGDHLASQQKANAGSAQFSILFSDIGKTFYAKEGWQPLGDKHISIPVVPPVTPFELPSNVAEIKDNDIPALAKRDEELLRQQVARPNGQDPNKVRVAVLPDMDTWQWQFAREDYIRQYIHGRTPTVRGAIYTPPSNPSARVWALWARTRYGGAEGHPVSNIMHFLRFVIEDEDAISDQDLAAALKGIFAVANKECNDWDCTRIDMWSPSDRILKLISNEAPELKAALVTRQDDNIASLRWFGDGSDDDIEWVATEKYTWC